MLASGDTTPRTATRKAPPVSILRLDASSNTGLHTPTIFNSIQSSPLSFCAVFPQRTVLPLGRRWRRHLTRAFGGLLALICFFFTLALIYGGIPPSYAVIRAQERALPQHRWGKANGNNRDGKEVLEDSPKYLRFPDHIWGHGFNNVLQEAILAYHLAYTVRRTYVFEDYVWSRLPFPFTLYDFTLRPTRVPMSAFIGGALVGTMDHNEGLASKNPTVQTTINATSRSISAEYFKHVCLPSETVEVVYDWPEDVYDFAASVFTFNLTSTSCADPRCASSPPFPSRNALADEIIAWWNKRLEQTDIISARCVLVREYKRRIWDWDFFGTELIHPLFHDIHSSPALKSFSWSPLVNEAANRGLYRLFGHKQSTFRPKNTHITGLLAIHLRRGDYKRHCLRLAHWGAGYMGFNRLEGIADRLEAGENETMAEKEARYLVHCLPSVSQIVKRLHNIREEYGRITHANVGLRSNQYPYRLRKVYVLTNGRPSFARELEDALMIDGWGAVFGTPDLEDDHLSHTDTAFVSVKDLSRNIGRKKQRRLKGLTREEKGVGVTVDMALAENAEVFVGNGFSSMSANIVMLRTFKGFPLHSNRLL